MAARIRTGLSGGAGHGAIPELDRQGLRRFGLSTGAIVAGLFGLLLPWLFGAALPVWPWVVLAVLGLWALVAPDLLRPVYRAWMRLGLVMNRITLPIIMGLVFYLVLAPIGLVFRLTGRDPLRRRLAPAAASYTQAAEQPPRDNLERPF